MSLQTNKTDKVLAYQKIKENSHVSLIFNFFG